MKWGVWKQLDWNSVPGNVSQEITELFDQDFPPLRRVWFMLTLFTYQTFSGLRHDICHIFYTGAFSINMYVNLSEGCVDYYFSALKTSFLAFKSQNMWEKLHKFLWNFTRHLFTMINFTKNRNDLHNRCLWCLWQIWRLSALRWFVLTLFGEQLVRIRFDSTFKLSLEMEPTFAILEKWFGIWGAHISKIIVSIRF